MSGGQTQGGGGSYSPGGTGAGGGNASFGGTNNISNSETDNSNAAAQAQTNYGANLNASEGGTLNYSGSDYGAIQAGQHAFDAAVSLSESAVIETAKVTARQTETAQEAIDKALELGKVSAQGDAGKLINGLIWIFGLGATGLGLWAYFNSKKKGATNA